MKNILTISLSVSLLFRSMAGEDVKERLPSSPEGIPKEYVAGSPTPSSAGLNIRLHCIMEIAKDFAAIRSEFSELDDFSLPDKFSIPNLRYRHKVIGHPMMVARGTFVPPYIVETGGCDIAISLYGPNEIGWQGVPFGPKSLSYIRKLADGSEICVSIVTPNDNLRKRMGKIVADHIKRDL